MPCTCGLKICICIQATSPVDLRDAVASYEILEMKPGFPITKQFRIDLDKEDLDEVERTAEGHNFRFPIAFCAQSSAHFNPSHRILGRKRRITSTTAN